MDLQCEEFSCNRYIVFPCDIPDGTKPYLVLHFVDVFLAISQSLKPCNKL